VDVEKTGKELNAPAVAVSAVTREGIETLKMAMVKSAPKDWTPPTILGDIISPSDMVVLVVPIDLAAPKGRLILPQVQTIRDILDNDAMTMIVKERELKAALGALKDKPRLVVTDSQAFLKVAADTPQDVLMTSFSILFARYKGNLKALAEGVKAIEDLVPGDKVLIAEACTHHRVEDDIGTVKIPRWLRQFVGGALDFKWASGAELPSNLKDYKLIVHCGACMINRKEMLHRLMMAQAAGVPMVNYGMLIAHVMGILKRALKPFPEASQVLEEAGD
jgi:[FeFe] hydrogenase H-cluster maturation GTPase HydF